MLVSWHWPELAVEGLYRFQLDSWFSSPFSVSFWYNTDFSAFCSLNSWLGCQSLSICSYGMWAYREIWSCLCIHSSPHYCSSILSFLRLCRYASVSNKLVDNQKCTFLVILVGKWCILFAGMGGLSYLQFCNLNSFRTKFILGFSIFLGLSVPQYFNEYTAINGFGPVHTRARWVRKGFPLDSYDPFTIRVNF